MIMAGTVIFVQEFPYPEAHNGMILTGTVIILSETFSYPESHKSVILLVGEGVGLGMVRPLSSTMQKVKSCDKYIFQNC